MRKLRIVSYNTWKCDGDYHRRLPKIVSGLQQLDPDIVCLQEAFQCEGAGADTSAKIAEALAMHVFDLKARYKKRAFKGKERHSYSNLAMIVSPSFSQETDIKLPSHEKDDDRWAMTVKETATNYPIIKVTNTHLTHVRDAEGVRLRALQAEVVKSISKPQENCLSIVCGDFNALWESADLSPLSQLDDLVTPMERDLKGSMIGPKYNSSRVSPRIDFVFVRCGQDLVDRVRVVREFVAMDETFGKENLNPSDHAAVVVDLEVTPLRG